MKHKRRIIIGLIVAVVLVLAISVVSGNLSSPEIPKLYFEGNIAEMYEKTDVREIWVEYVDGDEHFEGFAHLKVQGSSSLRYAKKNYTIKFFNDIDGQEKMPVDLGWGAQNTYCLKANWIDRTHARNVVTAKLASQVQQKYGLLTQAPCNGPVDGFPVEIYSNGDFLGLYTFNIPKGAWQFGMDSDNPNHTVVCGEGWEPANLFHGEPDFTTWELEAGEESEETLENLRVLFDFVMNSTDEEFVEHFEEHLSLDAALNYYVMLDVAYLPDNTGKNMILASYDGVKWYLSLYDLDTSWGAQWTGLELCEYDNKLVKQSENYLFERMEQCFPEELANRYFELRQDILSNEHIMEEFISFRDRIPKASFMKEAWKWGSGYIHVTSDLPGYDYDQIEEYLNSTSDRLDAKYRAMSDNG